METASASSALPGRAAGALALGLERVAEVVMRHRPSGGHRRFGSNNEGGAIGGDGIGEQRRPRLAAGALALG